MTTRTPPREFMDRIRNDATTLQERIPAMVWTHFSPSKIEFTVDRVKFSNTWPIVYGLVRVSDWSRHSELLVIDALLEGSFAPRGGFLAVKAIPKPFREFPTSPCQNSETTL